MHKIYYPKGGLVVLSGLPGSGKTTVTQMSGITSQQLVSMDAIRKDMVGEHAEFHDGKWRHDLSGDFDVEAGIVADLKVKARMREGLTTVVDSTNLTDSNRGDWIKHAMAFNRPFKVIIFDVSEELAATRNATRDRKVPHVVMSTMFEVFQRTSTHPHEVITAEMLEEGVILEEEDVQVWSYHNTDVIGDVHGNYEDLMLLLAKAGWVDDGCGLLKHPQQRKLLFLGDLVDRGPDSIKVLLFVMQMSRAGRAQLLLGNHEAKVLRFVSASIQDKAKWTSPANAETGCELLKLDPNLRTQCLKWLESRPHLLKAVHDDQVVLFCHGDLAWYGDNLTKSECVYGSSRIDYSRNCDRDFYLWAQEEQDKTGLSYRLVRGHIQQKDANPRVISLETDGENLGSLSLLRMETLFQGESPEIIQVKSSACWPSRLKEHFTLQRSLRKLVKDKLAYAAASEEHPLVLYKYAKSVFYQQRWKESETLIRARGIVLDYAGAIISNPFDKVYNYGEYDAGLEIPDEEIVVAPLKMNGYLGVMSFNPYSQELLLTTQGSFGGEFLEMYKGLVSKTLRVKAEHVLKSRNLTVMFEVIHPEDPHIISYSAEEQGLYLIGARENTMDARELPEEALDELAEILGVKRVPWVRIAFGELKQKVAQEQVEGYMVRKNTPIQETVCKFKTPFYLTTKFLGRLSGNNIRHMYNAPASFKQKVDEEFFPIVDWIVSGIAQEKFLEMTQEERVSVVRELILSHR